MILQQIRQASPIIQCITNIVSANFQANGLLAVGASPIMADSINEAAEMLQKVDALSLNIGTLNDLSVTAMLTAGRYANQYNKPVVLDPVGVGFTQYRTKMAERILNEVNISLIRCNYGELAALANIQWNSKGVDSGSGDLDTLKVTLQKVAKQYHCLIAMTGAHDFLVSSEKIVSISGGNKLITAVTASGCLLSSLCAASLTVAGNTFSNIEATLRVYKQAATIAKAKTTLLGSYQTEFINALNLLSLKEKL